MAAIERWVSETSRTELTRTRAPGRRDPVGPPGQRAGPEVEHPLVTQQLAVADVERLVVDQQPDQLAVGDVDHRLAGLREAEAGLGVGQRAQLVHAVEVGAGQAVRLALVQVAAPPDVPVGQREQRLGLGQHVAVQRAFPQAPRLDRERRVLDHRSSSNSFTEISSTAPAYELAARERATLRPGRSVVLVTALPDGYQLPAIPASAGAMIFDRAGRLLILKPIYKSGWTIPGGVMEAAGRRPGRPASARYARSAA